jgi:hypothetical protein
MLLFLLLLVLLIALDILIIMAPNASEVVDNKPKSVASSKQIAEDQTIYIEAMNDFNKIASYKDSKDKSAQCKKLYIDDNMANAMDAAGKQKYKDALPFLENVLKIDSENSDAKQLKSDYEKAIAEKKAVEEKAKADQIAQDAAKKAAQDDIQKAAVPKKIDSNRALEILSSKVKLGKGDYFDGPYSITIRGTPYYGYCPVYDGSESDRPYLVNLYTGQLFENISRYPLSPDIFAVDNSNNRAILKLIN